MKFTVGDKVKHKDFGVGEIIGLNVIANDYAVEFENEHNGSTHNFPTSYMDAGLDKPLDRKTGYWCCDDEIELVEETPKNLIPQIAKMLGVEIGEEFEINEISNIACKFADEYLLSRDKGEAQWSIAFVQLSYLLSGEWHIKKLFNKPHLTEDEKAILRNLPEKYKYIARDKNGTIYIYTNKPEKFTFFWSGNDVFLGMTIFSNLFQFIKWEDSEAYNIEELLKE